jgi:hypothetical protein
MNFEDVRLWPLADVPILAADVGFEGETKRGWVGEVAF